MNREKLAPRSLQLTVSSSSRAFDVQLKFYLRRTLPYLYPTGTYGMMYRVHHYGYRTYGRMTVTVTVICMCGVGSAPPDKRQIYGSKL